uniref:Uncharacterized protein n=1 Tax=Macaca fascicularis TaxID=9541 RepID=A0A7N9DG64_MACFA
CWDYSLGMMMPKSYLEYHTLCHVCPNSSGAHVEDVQICYIVILVP